MTVRLWLRIAELVCATLLVLAIYFAWRADRRDRTQLASELASTKQLLAAADARQHDRDSQLSQTLAALATEKRTIVTPAQIIRELPKTIPLPAPVTLQPVPLQIDQASSVGATLASPTPNARSAPPSGASPALTGDQSAPDGAYIPRADLKPLYDFALDCKACQAKLATTQSDLADERAKTAALTKERDDALKIARGGSASRRLGRAGKWLLVGVAAGAIAAKAAH